MKTFKHLIYLLIMSVVVTSCSRDFDEPPLLPPKSDLAGKQNISIKDLKEKYKDINDPVLIDTKSILKATVSANDISGNIYMQLYVQDSTGTAIYFNVQQNNIYIDYRVGQQVYIDLHGLYMVKYGGELQVGYGGVQANRIPEEIFKEHIQRDGFTFPERVVPLEVELNALADSMVNRVVLIKDIYFVNAEAGNKFTSDNQTTNEPISDADGNRLDVRTSAYAPTLAKDTLPKGYGSLVGVLGRYNGAWQLFLRDKNDIKEFGLSGPILNDEVFFVERFGSKNLSSVSPKPGISEYDDYDNTDPSVTYTGNGDIRSTGALGNHVWLAASSGTIPARNFKVEGLGITGETNVKLSYDMTANLYNPGEQINVNALKVKCNGVNLSVPNFMLTNEDGYFNKYYKVEITGLPENITSLEFYTEAENTLGIRVDNIKLYTGSDSGQ